MKTSPGEHPILKTQFTKTDFTLEAIAFLVFIAIWVLPIINYISLPDLISTHFDIQGKADNYGSKSGIFLLPVISFIFYTGLTILNNFPHKFNYPVEVTEKNASQLYKRGTRLIRILKTFVLVLFLSIEVLICRSSENARIPTWFLPVVLLVPVVLPVVMTLTLTKRFSNVKKI